MPKPTRNDFNFFEKNGAGDSGDPIDITMTFGGTGTRYCVFIVAFNNNDNQHLTSVVIDPGGGDELALSVVANTRVTVGGDDGECEVWTVKDPPVGTFTVRGILGETTRTIEKCSAGCWALSDVDPDNPETDVGTFSCTCSTGNITVTTTVDDILFAHMFLEDGSSITVDSPGVEDRENTAGDDASHAAHQDGVASSTNLEWSYGSDKSCGSCIAIRGGAPATVEQEGFRFFDDDANEASSTALAAQDTNITRARNLNTRLRALGDWTNDPDTQQATYRYRKVGDADSEWRAVPL